MTWVDSTQKRSHFIRVEYDIEILNWKSHSINIECRPIDQVQVQGSK